MKATIKSLTLQNFKGCKEKTYQFDGKNATVSGANASGKTTILDAFWWCLFNKDSLGNEKFSIRPLDVNGNVIHNVEIKVSVLMDLNGREMEFTKTQKEKWVKKRGTDATELQGNENLYEIDGYPKSEKDYKMAISEIVSEEIFKMITSPTYFPSMKWKEQRDILMRFVSDVSDYDFASGKSDFSELLEEIQKAPSLDDIKAKYQKALNEWKKKQSEIPVRIDELEKYKGQIETHISEIEVLKSKLERLPVTIDVSKSEDLKKLQDNISQIEVYLSKISNTDDISRSIEDDNRQLNQALLEVERQIAKSEQNNDIDDRISQLQVEQREIAQKVADQEKMLYLLEEFIRYKMDMISESINSKFDGINFKLFENQINGGLKETCEITVNGVPYGSLNNGHRIVACLQIIKALKGLYDVSMPVFIDNAESVNDFNLPSMDCQLILLKVSESDLKVEV